MVFDICYGFLLQVKVAIIGVEAGGVGLNFSAAKNVVFVELPKTPSLLLQVFPVLFFFFFLGPLNFMFSLRRLFYKMRQGY